MEERILMDFSLVDYLPVAATKNISDVYPSKFVNITLTYSNGKNEVKISSSCERSKDYTLIKESGFKVLLKISSSEKEIKKEHRVFSGNKPSSSAVEDLDSVEDLFDNFPDNLKRVFL